jgi:NAD dependent epimerase/dehydratase family enzyme
MANSTILASARVHPAKLMQAGYRFEFPVLEPAFRHVLGGDPGTSFQA